MSFGDQSKKIAAEVFKSKGNDHFKNSEFDLAISCYTQALAADPNAIIFGNRAMAFYKSGIFDKAIEDCNSALDLDNEYVKGYYRRGLSRKQLKKYSLALDDFKKVLQLDANNKEALKEVQLLTDLISSSQSNGDDFEHSQVTPTNCQKPSTGSAVRQTDDLLLMNDIKARQVPSQVPKTYYQFECDWRQLIGPRHNQLRLDFLKMIGPNQLAKIFSTTVEPQVFSDIIQTLAFCQTSCDDMFVFEVLAALTKVERFQTLVMFLSEEDVKNLRALIVKMYDNELIKTKVEALSKCWGISQ